MKWFRRKETQGISEYDKFCNLMEVAKSLPQRSLPYLISGLARRIQSQILVMGIEGSEMPTVDSDVFFGFGNKVLHSIHDLTSKVDVVADEHTIALGRDVVLPWPWRNDRFVGSMSAVGSVNGNPWKQDDINHYVDLWMPWGIGFVNGGNHSITAGILMGEGEIIPEAVIDCSGLLEAVRTDGKHWFIDDTPVQRVSYGAPAAIFEMGRLLLRKEDGR